MKHTTFLIMAASVAVGVPTIFAAAPAWAQAGGFTGTYVSKNDGSTVTLTLNQSDDGAITGTFAEDADKMDLRGRVTDGGKRITGKLVLQGQEIPVEFEIRRESGGKLRFVMKMAGEEDALLFTSTGGGARGAAEPAGAAPERPKNTSTKPSPKKAAPTAAAPAAPAAMGGRTYRHPSGLRLPLGKGWTLAPTGVLLPPGATKPNASEGYLIVLTEKPDLVLQKFEAQLQQSGQLRRAEVSGPGFAYEGDANGVAARIRCFVAQGGNGVSALLIANGTKAKMRQREPTLQAMMRGATFAAPDLDPRLFGSWSGGLVTTDRDVRGTGGRLQVSGASDSKTTYRLNPNGVFNEITTSRSIFIGQGVSLDTGDQTSTKEARWAARDGVLTISVNGVYVTGSYRFQGDQLVVRIGDKTMALRQN